MEKIKNTYEKIPKITPNQLDEYKVPIIFDTNFLFVTFSYDVDVIREIEKRFGENYNLFIFEGTISELEKIYERKDKSKKKNLPLVLKFLDIYNFKIISSDNSYVDKDMIDIANENLIFATSDKNLKRKIRDKKGKIMYLRQKSYIEIE